MHTRAVPYGGAPWKGGSNYVNDAPSRALAVQSEAQVRCQLAERRRRAVRIRLDTATLNLDRKQLGSVPRAYEGINAVALLMAERQPAVVRSG